MHLRRTAPSVVLGAAALAAAWACGLDTDRDGDGYYASDELAGLVQYDCDDYDPDVNQGEAWSLDADGDGLGAHGGTACYACLDADATPPPSSATRDDLGCTEDATWVFNALDCDDADAEAGVGLYYYRDADGDGYGDPDLGVAAYTCPLEASDAIPTGYVDNSLDCDDGESSTTDVATTYYLDADGDGYGGDTAVATCDATLLPTDWTATGEDCDDTIATVNPGEPDCLNSRDDDCDDREDEDEVRTWYYDADGDGYGDPDVTQEQCPPDDGYLDTGGDCDDTDAAIYPGIDDCDDVAEP